MADFKHCSLLLECAKCEMVNYLDPFTFWFFEGKVKCAGCGAIWALKIDNGTRVSGPSEAKAPHDKLPGYAQTKDYKTKITDTTKVNPPVMARADFVGKPIPIYKSIRGKPVSGGPLKPEDLVGSRPRFIMEGRHYQYGVAVDAQAEKKRDRADFACNPRPRGRSESRPVRRGKKGGNQDGGSGDQVPDPRRP